MFDFLKEKVYNKSDPRSNNAKSHGIPEGQPVQMHYASRDVAIPEGFLSLAAPPPDAKPVTISPVDWASSPLPEYNGLFAVVLENVLSPSECQTLIDLAESSADVSEMNSTGDHNPWKPAMVNAGSGFEVLDSGYRNSDRIVWDQQEVVDRIWQRCLQGEAAEALKKRLDLIDGDEQLGAFRRRGPKWTVEKQRWEFRRLNQRMRFLKYGAGQFFRRKSIQPGYGPSSSIPRERSWRRAIRHASRLTRLQHIATVRSARRLMGRSSRPSTPFTCTSMTRWPKLGRAPNWSEGRHLSSQVTARGGLTWTQRRAGC